MKTYLKRPYEKPLTDIYYSYSDILTHFSTHVDFRQRVVQPSTKEQQRLLSSSSSNKPRLQHVHYGKYGIKPLEPSDRLLYTIIYKRCTRNNSEAHGRFDVANCLYTNSW